MVSIASSTVVSGDTAIHVCVFVRVQMMLFGYLLQLMYLQQEEVLA